MNHLTETALAARLSVSRRTLQKWRASGEGPPFMRLGGAIRYNVEDVELWEVEKKQRPLFCEAGIKYSDSKAAVIAPPEALEFH